MTASHHSPTKTSGFKAGGEPQARGQTVAAAPGPGCWIDRVINTSLVKKSGAIFKIFPPHSFTEDSRSRAQSTQCFRKANETVNDLVEIAQNYGGDTAPHPHPGDMFATVLSGDGRSEAKQTFLTCSLFPSPWKAPALPPPAPGFREFSAQASEPGCGPCRSPACNLGQATSLLCTSVFLSIKMRVWGLPWWSSA